MAAEVPLHLQGLTAAYGKQPVLHGLDLTVQPGEIFGLVGLNGVGKTTLITALLGLRPYGGQARLFGLPAGTVESRRRLAYLPERYQPSPLLKGWEVLSLTLSAYGLALDRDKAQALCQGLDFEPEALPRLGKSYSKGMGQKLGLAACLLTDQPLLILDEPMSGLDPRARIRLKDRLREHRDRGGTVFFSSHILGDVEELCDRIAVMQEGRLIFTGPPAALVEREAAANLERAFLSAIEKSPGD